MKRLTAKNRLAAIVASPLLSALAGQAGAQDLEISIHNLTHGLAFTPVLVAAHDSSSKLYAPGEAASASLQAMAEGGDLSGLKSDLDAIAAVYTDSGGFLMAGDSVTVMLNTDSNADNRYLSLVAMLLPTNDGFVGMNSMAIPSEPGTYHYYLNAYDAGTEANDELLVTGGGAPGEAGIPGDPGGLAGSGGSGGAAGADSNDKVHIHRGVLGDKDASGGNSDLDSSVHRWMNPVAHVTVVVK